MKKRVLGRSGIAVSPLGLGCWAVGGDFILGGLADGWGGIDDAESMRAIRRALELGINFIDTADAYGVGHSEAIIGKAIAGKRNEVVIATKFGFFGNESTKILHGINLTPQYIERACEASLKRLNTDYLDLYQLHVGDIAISEIEPIGNTLDQLVAQGKIRTYGWSTDLVPGARLFAENIHCSAIQFAANVFCDNPKMVDFCDAADLAAITRSPLAMGLLSGKYTADSVLGTADVRGAGHAWVPYFANGKPAPEFLKKIDQVKEILTSNGRSLTQGALAWIWGKSGRTIPIPGFKTVKQVEENARAMEFGALSESQMKELERILS